MPDISMCCNDSCTIKNSCYRYIANPSTFRQSYTSFSQNEDNSCDHFIEPTDEEYANSAYWQEKIRELNEEEPS